MFISFDKTRQVWLLYYHDSKGIRRKISTKTSNKREAYKFAESFIPPNSQLSITLIKYQAEFIKQNGFRLKKKSVEAFEHTFKFFREAIGGGTILHELTTKDIKLYLLERANKSIYQARKDRINLHKFFQCALADGYVEKNPVSDIPMRDFKIPEKMPLFYTEDEIKRLSEHIKDKDLRDMCEFAVNTGMRQMELLELKWRQVDMKRKLVILSNRDHITKTSRVRSIPLNNTAMRILEERQMLIAHEYVFLFSGKKIKPNNLEHRLKKHIRALNLCDDFNFHTFRHTFASWLVQRGIPLLVVSQLLGHRNIKTTQIYAHLAPSNTVDAVKMLD